MRIIDADALLEKMYKYSDNEGAKMPYGDNDSLIHRDSACFLIENAPTIEPEHLIRCKDCRWKHGSGCVRFADVRPFPDDFCSRAERRGEQDENN